MDEQVAQCFSLDSWIFWTIVCSKNATRISRAIVFIFLILFCDGFFVVLIIKWLSYFPELSCFVSFFWVLISVAFLVDVFPVCHSIPVKVIFLSFLFSLGCIFFYVRFCCSFCSVSFSCFVHFVFFTRKTIFYSIF